MYWCWQGVEIHITRCIMTVLLHVLTTAQTRNSLWCWKGLKSYIDEKGTTCISIENGNLFIPQKGQPVCPTKKGTLFIPHKGQLVCPSEKDTCLSLKNGNLFIPQKGHPITTSWQNQCLVYACMQTGGNFYMSIIYHQNASQQFFLFLIFNQDIQGTIQ